MENITEHFYIIARPNGMEERYMISFYKGKVLNIRTEFGYGHYVSIALFNPKGLDAAKFRMTLNYEVC